MSQIVSVTESQQLIDENPALVRRTCELYKNPARAASQMHADMGPVNLIWESAGLRTPRIGHLLIAFEGLCAREKTEKTQDEKEREVARKYEVFVAIAKDPDHKDEVVHALIARETGVVTEIAADLLTAECEPFEEDRPGFTTFLGDLVSLFDFSGSMLKPRGNDAAFRQAAPAPYYSYERLAAWASLYGGFFVPSEGQSPRTCMLSHVGILGHLPHEEFVRLQTSFYRMMMRWDTKIKLDSVTPIDQLGAAYVGRRSDFLALKIPQAERNQLLYRTRGWDMDVRPPQTTKQALDRLSATRSWRGEGRKGYSALTRGHACGGELSDTRIQVNRMLALALPHLINGDTVCIRPDSLPACAFAHTWLIEHADEVGITGQWVWQLSQEAARGALGEEWKRYTVGVCPSESLLIDLVSSELMSFAAKTDVDKSWMASFKEMLPDVARYICRRKAPPAATETYNVFAYGSIHAFDALVSSFSEIVLAGVDVTLRAGKATKKRITTVAAPIKSAAALLQLQHDDDRRKLCFHQWGEAPLYDPTMNNWTPPPVYTKATRKDLAVLIEEAGTERPLQDFGDGGVEEERPLRDFGVDEEILLASTSITTATTFVPPPPLIQPAPSPAVPTGGESPATETLVRRQPRARRIPADYDV